MSRKTVRVEIPENPDDLLDLLKKVIAKHKADTTGSPLNVLEMDTLETQYTDADTANEDAKRLRALAEIRVQTRDNIFGSAQLTATALFILTQIRDLLLLLHKDDPQALQEWGFKVVEGTASAKTTNSNNPS